jgi:hypothetical protein
MVFEKSNFWTNYFIQKATKGFLTTSTIIGNLEHSRIILKFLFFTLSVRHLETENCLDPLPEATVKSQLRLKHPSSLLINWQSTETNENIKVETKRFKKTFQVETKRFKKTFQVNDLVFHFTFSRYELNCGRFLWKIPSS